MNTISTDRLAELLRNAETAHALYEKQIGHRDDNWPQFYAQFVVGQLNKGVAAAPAQWRGENL